jgi:hypothetical protein
MNHVGLMIENMKSYQTIPIKYCTSITMTMIATSVETIPHNMHSLCVVAINQLFTILYV